LVYLALAEKLVEKLAGIFFELLHLGRLSISFAPCFLKHGVQQVLLESPFSASVSLWKNLVAYALGVEVRSVGSPNFF
jgi:hypothetical protein